jgi:hypothetical protein
MCQRKTILTPLVDGVLQEDIFADFLFRGFDDNSQSTSSALRRRQRRSLAAPGSAADHRMPFLGA